MRHGSLFSGIGGFDLAAEWMGWNNVFHCEINPFGQKVLHHYWPNAIQYSDITKTDFTKHADTIDIISGGFPCQPYSIAGKRKGKEDDRHLWPEMLRAIREIQPRWIVGENVPGLLNWNGGMVLDEIKSDLEAEGFEVFPPLVLPACGLNAPHRRDRLWIVANSKCSTERQDRDSIDTKRTRPAALQTKDEGWITTSIFDSGLDVLQGYSSNTGNKGLQRSKIIRGFGAKQQNRNEQFAGLFPSNWQEFPTQSPLCNGNDGLSTQLDGITFSKWRNESIKAGGNAIVPQIAFEIFKAIEQVENSTQ